MKEAFISKTFRGSSLAMIEQANQILDEYADDGFTLTLRQLYYQFVARGLIENQQKEYKRLGAIIADGRRAGLVDWRHIEDRTRGVEEYASWSSPSEIIKAAATGYKEDVWRSQSFRAEVWIEKAALVGVIKPVCDRWRIPHIAARGYPSISELYDAGKRFKEMIADGLEPAVFYLGDHDPSGLDMGRNLRDALALYAGYPISVTVLGLNLGQIRSLDLPPNPAKETDKRFADYVSATGCVESWELDAVTPTFIDKLIDDAVSAEMDNAAWDEAVEQEERNRSKLTELADGWAA
jgi:hypothetical protein